MTSSARKSRKPSSLVEVAARLGDEPGHVGLGALDRADVELEAVAELLDAGEHPDGVALAEARVEHLDVAPDAALDAARRVDELEHQVRAPGPGAEAPLPADCEDAFDGAILDQIRDPRLRGGRDGHATSLGSEADAEAARGLG